MASLLEIVIIIVTVPLVYWQYVADTVVAKLSSIMPLMAITLWQKSTYAQNLGKVMIVCIIGDIFIQLADADPTETYFLLGLGSFMVAQAAFSVVFYDKVTFTSFLWLPAFLLYYFALISRLFLKIGEKLRIAVVIYGFVILSMGFFAFNRFTIPEKYTFTSRLFCLLGAFMFIVSDTLLALDKFDHMDFGSESAKFIVFVTYYIGQVLMTISALGVVDVKAPAKSPRKTK